MLYVFFIENCTVKNNINIEDSLGKCLNEQTKGSYDILLAGVALNNQLIFVSSNTNEFNRIHSLILENWRLPLDN